ncbi:MAG: AraC family transcriptional regulator [Ruminococcaceae bacterium]|nr:AraC family transcriptional regulator [Oscillospiraceae bacterium]
MCQGENTNAFKELAEHFIATVEKRKIIAHVFDYCDLNGIDRRDIDPSELDGHVKAFIDSDYSDSEALSAVIRTIQEAKGGTEEENSALVRGVLEYISDHLTENKSVEDIAQLMHVSYYYLCHCFKQRTGASINSYRTKLRIEKAVFEIVRTNKKITSIATECGFNNSSYFTETFTKLVGVTPMTVRKKAREKYFHGFYDYDDIILAAKMDAIRFGAADAREISDECVTRVTVHEPDETFKFLHQPTVIEYEGVLYAAWYNSRRKELRGYTPVCGKRSYDGGRTWSDIEIIAHDPEEKVLYCPPVFGICGGRLYMLVNEMVAADHIHALDLYILNRDTGKFEFVWSRPIPFKLNTNVVSLPNGKLMLTGRAGELDRFPNIPAVLISDSGRIDGDWRMIRIAQSGDLPDGTKLVHPELSVMCYDDRLYMFSRNDQRRIPLVYVSEDFGEHWSHAFLHDIPYVSSKIFCGKLSCGRHFVICNTDRQDRSRLSVYFTDRGDKKLACKLVLFDRETAPHGNAEACHYPAACEHDGKLHIIASLNYGWDVRGAVMFTVDLEKLFQK